MQDNIIAGIVAGLVVTLFIVIFRLLWKKVVEPWVEDQVYKDVRIEGTWFGILPKVIGSRPETIALKRHGHTITGTSICNGGPDEGKSYTLSGTFRNMLLTLIYESSDKKFVDRGTITLRCVHNGERLIGQLASYDDTDDTVDSSEAIWFRFKQEQGEFIENKEQNHQQDKPATQIEPQIKELIEEDALDHDGVSGADDSYSSNDKANKTLHPTDE